MNKKFLKAAKQKIKNLLGIKRGDSSVDTLYEENDYLQAYSKHTDLRVEADSQGAIGGMWEEIGELQFEFLLSQNLKPQHKMLDIGCGTLRGGRHFINYLDSGNYYGIDISPKAISSAKELVQEKGLEDKVPHLLLNESMNLKFADFSGQQFDYILAQSVFTHLKPEHIEECFEHIGSVMHPDSAFYFTYNKGDEYAQLKLKDFCYPFSYFESLADKHGFALRDCSIDYKHPREQNMLELRKVFK